MFENLLTSHQTCDKIKTINGRCNMKTLREFRLALGKTLQQMADDLNISKSMYEKLESGDRKPSREFIEKVKMKYPLIDVSIFLNLDTTKRVENE